MKSRFLKINLVLSIILSLLVTTTYGAGITSEDVLRQETMEETVAPGVVYVKKSLLTTYGFVDIHMLKVDLDNEWLSLDILRSLDGFGYKTRLSDLSETVDGVVGGINGSFFDTTYKQTDIIGIEYEEDYTSIAHNYNVGGNGAASLIDNGTAMYVDFLGAQLSMKTENDFSLYITGLNRVTNMTGPVVFNSNAGSSTKEIPSILDTYKIVVENGVVTQVVASNTDANIPESGYVIALPYDLVHNESDVDYLTPFEVGTGVDFNVSPTLTEESLKMVFSGGGKILENGEVVEATKMVVSSTARHPRSAIGLTEDGSQLIAMVVDGRGSSIGATHNEMAQYLLDAGVFHAMHLDGGGSSTLGVSTPGQDDVIAANTPSDGTERKVVNGLGFVSSAPSTEEITLEVKADKTKVFVGDSINFETLAYDSNYNTVEIASQDIYFLSQGIQGVWEGLNFTPTSGATGIVTAYFGDLQKSVTITSLDSFYDIDVSPSILVLGEEETGSFKVEGTSIDGFQDIVPNDLVTYELTNQEIGSFEEGVFTPSGIVGYSKVRISAGTRSVTAYITVGNEETLIGDFEDKDSFGKQMIFKKIPVTLEDGTVESTDVPSGDGIYEFNYMSHKTKEPNTGEGHIEIQYNLDAQDDYVDGFFVEFKDIVVKDIMNQMDISIKGLKEDMSVALTVTDAGGLVNTINLSPVKEVTDEDSYYDYRGKMVDATYPVEISGIRVTYSGGELVYGKLLIDTLTSVGVYKSDEFLYDYEPLMTDPLLETTFKPDQTITVFGATSGRNRLLDEVVLANVYSKMSESDVAYFAGTSDVETGALEAEAYVWDNSYQVIDLEDVRIIQLATYEGGLLASDPEQWEQFEKDLASAYQNNVIIIGNKNPRLTFENKREGLLVHKIMSDYVKRTGSKNVFYINASGYDFDVDYYDGIRYITMNGLWYFVNDQKVNLTDTFYLIDFYIKDHELTYSMRNVYPKIEIE